MSAPGLEPLFLAGPTAVGKSEVALLLAEELGGEIISVDSMQVYQGMSVGTAKPSAAEQDRIPHHLLDVADLSENFDAAQFCERANDARQAIEARGHVPIFCGGTGLYFKAYLHGLGTTPPTDPALRTKLEALPLDSLLQELQARDPKAFETIDRRNARRVVRAVEVIRLTGEPVSHQRADWNPSKAPGRFFALNREPGDLRRRINSRVDRMFERGLVDEVCRLLKRGLAQNRTALQALGYRQVAEHLEGKRSLGETTELVKIRTWQFARRQLTWFRRQLPAEWLHVSAEEPAEETAVCIQARVNRPSDPHSMMGRDTP